MRKKEFITLLLCAVGSVVLAQEDPLEESLIGPVMQEVFQEGEEDQIQLYPFKENGADEEQAKIGVCTRQGVEEGGEERDTGSFINDIVELGGAIEVEAFWARDFDNTKESDIVLEAAELDFEVFVTDWMVGLLAIEWEPDDEELTIKEAFVTFGGLERCPYFFRTGRLFVPFGIGTGAVVGDTLSVSDPLTIEIFEAREDVIMVGKKWRGWYAAAYIFNGDTNRGGGDDHIEQYGATLRYGMERPDLAYSIGLDFISSVFDSDSLQEDFPAALEAKYAPGIAAHIRYFYNGFSFIAEYNGALRKVSFTEEDEDLRLAPKAWQIEVGYEHEICCHSTYFALNYSESYDLHGVFPRRRFLATVGRWLYEDILLAIEYGHDWDYSTSEGGTGKTADVVVGQLAYEW